MAARCRSVKCVLPALGSSACADAASAKAAIKRQYHPRMGVDRKKARMIVGAGRGLVEDQRGIPAGAAILRVRWSWLRGDWCKRTRLAAPRFSFRTAAGHRRPGKALDGKISLVGP